MDPALLIEKLSTFLTSLVPTGLLSNPAIANFPTEFSLLYVVTPLALAFALFFVVSLVRGAIQRRRVSSGKLASPVDARAEKAAPAGEDSPIDGLINKVRTTEASNDAHRERILDIELA